MTAASRVTSIDILRGLIIVLMMVDHVRERFYQHVRTGDPMYDTIEPDLFFTRLLTHFCAPMFIFLAGVSSWLYAHPSPDQYRSPSRFLIERGLVIIAIEIVLYRLVWLDSYPNDLFLQVLFAIGVCMIALGLVCRLNYWLLGALGLMIVCGHNTLDFVSVDPPGVAYVIWTSLHEAGDLFEIAGLNVSLSYPVLPWFGVILLGYFAGPLYSQTRLATTRQKSLVVAGLAALALLLILRGFNVYGEAEPWSLQPSALATAMSFLNYTKYPPSLDYLLLTLGVGMLVLAGLERTSKPAAALRLLEVFGSVPMFVYVVHLYMLLGAYWLAYLLLGPNHGERFGLNSVAGIWAGAIAFTLLLYPLARRFAGYKHAQKPNKPWLSYF
ncbi:MAG: heparan-alpha-glucosaminide N-acetyltransferase domain-containing protein [Pseudomonadota bacterium]